MSDPLDLSTATAESHFGRCAEVRVGDRVTRYVRRGSGLPVIIIGLNDESGPVCARLAAALLDGVRLIAPEPTVSPADFVPWLRGFVEGIGATSAAVIVGGIWWAAAAELQCGGAGDFRALIIVPPDTTSEADFRAATEAHRNTTVPTVWVRPEWTHDEALRRVEEIIGALRGARR